MTLGGNAISVAGSFAPVSGTAAHTVTLADGATLDFSQWAGSFPVEYPSLAFAENAQIALKFTPVSTELSNLAKARNADTGVRGGYVLEWGAIPTGVTFTGDGLIDGRIKVEILDGGIRAFKPQALSIIIR